MRRLTLVGVAFAVAAAGCGPATVPREALGVTARDALLEGRTRAATWDAAARLRWLEGVGISGTGVALPGAGEWRLHYAAPGRAAGLVVRVGSVETGEEERAPASPPGFVVGEATVPDTWLDSPDVLRRVLAERGGAVPEQVSILLVPAQPLQWVVAFPDEARRWRVDARTGQVLTP
jgi:hypothetical protein